MSLKKIKNQPIDKNVSEIYNLSNSSMMSCWRLVLYDGLQLFAKTCDVANSDRLKFEAEGLNQLRKFAKKDYLAI